MRKIRKKITKVHRGILIQQNGPYTMPGTSYRVVAFLPDIERNFRGVGQAKQYIDKNFDEIQRIINEPWPE